MDDYWPGGFWPAGWWHERWWPLGLVVGWIHLHLAARPNLRTRPLMLTLPADAVTG
jgi:hypothetical protein